VELRADEEASAYLESAAAVAEDYDTEFLDKVDYIWGIVREEAIAADAEKSE